MRGPDPLSHGAAAVQTAASSYAVHFRETLALAAPIIVSRAGLIVLTAVDTFAVGQAGSLELAAFGVGLAPMTVLMLVTLGALQGSVVLAAQAIGAGNPRGVGDIFRATCVNAFVVGLLSALLALAAGPFFRLTGQDPALVGPAAAVALHFAWGMPAHLMFLSAAMMLETIGRPRVTMWIMLAANALNLLLDGVFVLGWGGWFPEGGAAAATATTSLVRWGTFAIAMAVLLKGASRAGDPYGFLGHLRDWLRAVTTLGGRPGAELRRMGLPMGLSQGVESAAFASMTLLAGLMGAAVVAAHQATMTIMSLVYMNAVGVGGAASVRVGHAVGRRAGVDMRRAGLSAILTGGLLAGLCGLVSFLAHDWIAGHMVGGDPVTTPIAATTLAIAATLFAFDTMMGVSMGALRGLGDVWMPFWMQSAAFWFASVPVAAVVGLHLGYGAVGLYAGIGAGVLSSFAMLAPRFLFVAKRIDRAWNP